MAEDEERAAGATDDCRGEAQPVLVQGEQCTEREAGGQVYVLRVDVEPREQQRLRPERVGDHEKPHQCREPRAAEGTEKLEQQDCAIGGHLVAQ